MEGFTEIFFAHQKHYGGKAIQKGAMSLTYNPIAKSYGITFCRETSKEIKERKFTFARFFQNDVDGNISIVLNKTKGLPLYNSENLDPHYNIMIRNKELVEMLGHKFGLSFDISMANYVTFFISDNISRNNSVMSFLIKNDKPIYRKISATRRRKLSTTIAPISDCELMKDNEHD